MSIKSYRDLIVWNKSIDLCVIIYLHSSEFPKTETFGVTSQIRRASASIAANISEGWSRQTDKEKNRFFNIALGSLSELETFALISLKLNYINNEKYNLLMIRSEEIGKLISGMCKKLKTSNQEHTTLSANS
jgi:four helix bundle protein